MDVVNVKWIVNEYEITSKLNSQLIYSVISWIDCRHCMINTQDIFAILKCFSRVGPSCSLVNLEEKGTPYSELWLPTRPIFSFLHPPHSSWCFSNYQIFHVCTCMYPSPQHSGVSVFGACNSHLRSLLKTEMPVLHILRFWFSKIGFEPSIRIFNKCSR